MYIKYLRCSGLAECQHARAEEIRKFPKDFKCLVGGNTVKAEGCGFGRGRGRALSWCVMFTGPTVPHHTLHSARLVPVPGDYDGC